MSQSQLEKEIDILIPVIKRKLRVPKGASRLIFQLNYRGLLTCDVKWGDPLRITLESQDQFLSYLASWRRSGKSQIHRLFRFLVEDVKYEMDVLNPLKHGNHCDLFKVIMLIPQSKIEEFTQIFYAAHLDDDEKKQFLTLAK